MVTMILGCDSKHLNSVVRNSTTRGMWWAGFSVCLGWTSVEGQVENLDQFPCLRYGLLLRQHPRWSCQTTQVREVSWRPCRPPFEKWRASAGGNHPHPNQSPSMADVKEELDGEELRGRRTWDRSRWEVKVMVCSMAFSLLDVVRLYKYDVAKVSKALEETIQNWVMQMVCCMRDWGWSTEMDIHPHLPKAGSTSTVWGNMQVFILLLQDEDKRSTRWSRDSWRGEKGLQIQYSDERAVETGTAGDGPEIKSTNIPWWLTCRRWLKQECHKKVRWPLTVRWDGPLRQWTEDSRSQEYGSSKRWRINSQLISCTMMRRPWMIRSSESISDSVRPWSDVWSLFLQSASRYREEWALVLLGVLSQMMRSEQFCTR